MLFLSARDNQTWITITDIDDIQSFNLSESGQVTVDVRHDSLVVITADHPVHVVQYTHPGNVMSVPPVEHQQERYVFHTFDSVTCQRLVLVADSVSSCGLLLDGHEIFCRNNHSEDLLFRSHNDNTYYCTLSTVETYTVILLHVTPGYHELSHRKPGVTFTVMSACFSMDRYWVNSQNMVSNTYSSVNDVDQLNLDTFSESFTHSFENSSLLDDQQLSEVSSSQVDTFNVEDDVIQSFQNLYQSAQAEDTSGLSTTVIALITSLASAIFLVIFCIIGFFLAEFVCRRENFTRSKVTPYLK